MQLNEIYELLLQKYKNSKNFLSIDQKITKSDNRTFSEIKLTTENIVENIIT